MYARSASTRSGNNAKGGDETIGDGGTEDGRAGGPGRGVASGEGGGAGVGVTGSEEKGEEGERERGGSQQRAMLFFGCRGEKDFLYSDEWRELEEKGVIR